MTPTEKRVAAIMSHYGYELDVEAITPETAMAQDAHIDGIDVDDFVMQLREEFGSTINDIPWLLFSDQRDSARGCMAVMGVPFWLLWRWLTRPKGTSILSRPGTFAHPRLTVAHIARVIDQGRWEEPKDMAPYTPTPPRSTA